MFTYPPLDAATPQIRLVRLATQPQRNAGPTTISLELQSTPLGDERYPYAALSYVWDNPLSEAKSKVNGVWRVWGKFEIQVNGQPFMVKENLHDGLVQLQRNGVDSWLWIDALCINQADVEEKTYQVGLMADIFAGAEVVYIWLGVGCDDSDKLMDFIARLGPRAIEAGALDLWPIGRQRKRIAEYLQDPSANQSTDASDDDQDYKAARFLHNLINEPALRASGTNMAEMNDGVEMNDGFEDVLQRSYWHRLWVVQEIVLAKHAILMCGVKSVPLDEFEAVCTAVWHVLAGGYLALQPEAYMHFGHLLNGNLYNVSALVARSDRRHDKGVRLAEVIAQTGLGPGRPLYSASDPRDILFGLLGVIEDADELGLEVDYRRTKRDVYIRLTRSLLHDGMVYQEPYPLYSLEYCVPRGHGSDPLPSWVPDWQLWGRRGPSVYPVNYEEIFDASQGLCSRPFVLEPWKVYSPVLRWSGCRVDIITEVMEPPTLSYFGEWSVTTLSHDRSADWCRSLVSFAGIEDTTSGPGEDYIWRTVGMNQYRNNPVLWENGKGSPEEDEGYLCWLMRKILRQEAIDPQTLTDEQKRFIGEGRFCFKLFNPELETLEQKILFLLKDVPSMAASAGRGRTVFKTSKDMFCSGHVAIRKGDLVTLLAGCKAPIILRPRDPESGGGFEFMGDAYVDGIMHGEFLKNEHALEEFEIH